MKLNIKSLEIDGSDGITIEAYDDITGHHHTSFLLPAKYSAEYLANIFNISIKELENAIKKQKRKLTKDVKNYQESSLAYIRNLQILK